MAEAALEHVAGPFPGLGGVEQLLLHFLQGEPAPAGFAADGMAIGQHRRQQGEGDDQDEHGKGTGRGHDGITCQLPLGSSGWLSPSVFKTSSL